LEEILAPNNILAGRLLILEMLGKQNLTSRDLLGNMFTHSSPDAFELATTRNRKGK
jgi:hypothetical protein